MRNYLGSGNYNWTIKKIKQFANLKDDSPEAQIAKTALRRVREAKKLIPDTPHQHSDHELIAYFVEEAVYRGINPAQESRQTTKLGLVFRRLFNGALRILKAMGLPVKTLNAQDIVDVAYGAANLALRTPIDRITPLSTEVMYSLASRTKDVGA